MTKSTLLDTSLGVATETDFHRFCKLSDEAQPVIADLPHDNVRSLNQRINVLIYTVLRLQERIEKLEQAKQ